MPCVRWRTGDGNQNGARLNWNVYDVKLAGPQEVQTITKRITRVPMPDMQRQDTGFPALFVCCSCKGSHGAEQPRNLPPARNRFCHLASVFKRVLVSLRCPRRFPAVQPTAAVPHRRRLALLPVPCPGSAPLRPDVSLCSAFERPRYRAQEPRSARDRDHPDDLRRHRGWSHPPDHGACARLRRMGLVRLAGLSHQRSLGAASHGRSTDLCPPLCAVHPGRDRRGRRPRCTGHRCTIQFQQRATAPIRRSWPTERARRYWRTNSSHQPIAS